ncbi:putative phage abortive infection protein [Chryseobacterium chendengshani]|uniref:putative phage abortive infection protein n=1 Tax=Chryseobacterium sp. LJ668 TaxID=2864040 RepID=UPI001C688464|nr:putative phage abortive infection protein [Chryseobacterium sp. LJ668]MBW8522747.1 putative phage abortive infection protein [Chryseobacterium sp. LJ668]QYK16280.1 putative phage abortive infection protein [Chryseobacterium sp. LJ668]
MKKRDMTFLIWGSLLLISFTTLLLFLKFKDTNVLGSLGTTGDFIGGYLGTIVSIFATYLIFITYSSQKKELKLQRDLFSQQKFETTFFNMLNVHNELKKNLFLDYRLKRVTGDSAEEDSENMRKFGVVKYGYLNGFEIFEFLRNDFTKFYREFHIHDAGVFDDQINSELVIKSLKEKFDEDDNFFKNLNEDSLNIKPSLAYIDEWDENNNKLETHKNKILYLFSLYFDNYQEIISHYCRNVYHILKFIRENEELESKNYSDKKMAYKKYKQYANIFQSQLNLNEQFLLFYNFIHFNQETQNETYWTVNLVNHYKFLENIGIKNLIFKKHEEFYNFQIKGSDRII